jgi:Ca2+-binding EF-hand superfamily protein
MAGRALVGLGAVVFLSLGAWLPGLGGAEANRQDEVQDLVFLGETPLRIRLRILVSGQGFRARQRSTWDDYVRALFRHLDGDGNGRLTEAEARRMPPPPRLRSLAGLNTPVRVAFNFLAIDDNGDGTLTPRELADFYQDYGEGAFQVRPHQTNPASGQLLGQRLFARLDRDSNGKVDRKELQAAARLLADLDGDGDEMLSAAELLGAGVPAAQPGQPANTVLPQPDVPFLSLTPDTQGDLVQRLLDRYGKARPSQRVSVAELGLDPARFALLDGDRNGQLDAAELGRLFALPPDLEVVIRLGKTRKGSPTWEVVHAGTKSPLARHFQRTPFRTARARSSKSFAWRIGATRAFSLSVMPSEPISSPPSFPFWTRTATANSRVAN